MLRKIFGICILVLAISAPVFAEQTIAVVDVQKILQESSAGRIARDLLESSTKRAKEKIDGMKIELDGMQQRYETQSAVLSPESRQALEQEILEKQYILRQELQKSQMDLQSQDANLTSSILDDLKPILEEVAKEKGLSMIIEKGEAGVLYSEDKLDLTDIVLTRYDASKQKTDKK